MFCVASLLNEYIIKCTLVTTKHVPKQFSEGEPVSTKGGMCHPLTHASSHVQEHVSAQRVMTVVDVSCIGGGPGNGTGLYREELGKLLF